jgi:hypothetical protein
MEMRQGFAITIESDDGLHPDECRIECDPSS